MPGDRWPVHAAVLRLADLWGGDSPEEIAEVLGLRIDRVQKLLNDLEQGGEEIEREFVLWVDHARGRCLPHDALTGVRSPSARSQNHSASQPTNPTPTMIKHLGLEAGLSWDLGIEGSAQVLDVLDVVVDIRDRKLPYELRLPDTQLVITHNEMTDDKPWEFSVTQYDRGNHSSPLGARAPHRTPASPDRSAARLGKTPPTTTHAAHQPAHLDEHTPHPELLRDRSPKRSKTPSSAVVLCAPDLRSLPVWLEESAA